MAMMADVIPKVNCDQITSGGTIYVGLTTSIVSSVLERYLLKISSHRFGHRAIVFLTGSIHAKFIRRPKTFLVSWKRF